MSGTFSDVNIAVADSPTSGVPLPLASLHAATGYSAVSLGEVAEHFLNRRGLTTASKCSRAVTNRLAAGLITQLEMRAHWRGGNLKTAALTQ